MQFPICPVLTHMMSPAGRPRLGKNVSCQPTYQPPLPQLYPDKCPELNPNRQPFAQIMPRFRREKGTPNSTKAGS